MNKAMDNAKRYRIQITGIVQGIGFRPFIYREATKRGLVGNVFNHTMGVTVEVEGDPEDISSFVSALRSSPPPLADIHDISMEEIAPKGDREFLILESQGESQRNTLIPPDIATCEECLREIFDASNRRFWYPFTNCTNCGPRYTIIEDIPYDRQNTTMKRFEMCAECRREYTDQRDRRYHAQPNCCPACGPNLRLIGDGVDATCNESAIKKAVELLLEGKIIAIKGIGGFHLAVDATNNGAVQRLRKKKLRDEKPFALMMRDLGVVMRYAIVSDMEGDLLTSPRRPILLLKRRVPPEGPEISDAVAPENRYLGIMLPYNPLQHLIFEEGRRRGKELILVMTSGNISDEPICINDEEVSQRLKGIPDYLLTHTRDIHRRADDSIAAAIGGGMTIIRRARGYTPEPIPIPKVGKTYSALALGGELKNTVCLIKGGLAIISQHIGDLVNEATYAAFKETISHFIKLFNMRPEIIAYDMHPEYTSTRWVSSTEARDLLGSIDPIPVQHHHAHIASCMAENGLNEAVIGIAMDGTGYGEDGNIWGGEVFLADYNDARRFAHLDYLPLPGGEAAIKNTWQMAVSYLMKAGFSPEEMTHILKGIERERIWFVAKMIQEGINSPLTSSMGRLFDAVSAILNIKYRSTFEGQAAISLEMATSECDGNCYTHDIIEEGGVKKIVLDKTIREIVNAVMGGRNIGEISSRFHTTLAKVFGELAHSASKEYGIKKVVLSGGCFQNRILVERLKQSIEAAGLEVYTHKKVPPNDGGISLGQGMVAISRHQG